MAFVHGKGARLLLGVLDFSGFLRAHEQGTEIEMADSTMYGNEGHRFIPGLEQGTLSLDGGLDNVAAAGGQDATLDGALQAAAGTVITAAVEGLTLGKRVFMIEARETNYAVANGVTDIVNFSASWQSEGQVDSGVSLHDLTAETATTDGTSVDNTTSSANGAAASLHVTANTRSTATTIKVQHSADNVAFVDLITHAVVGAGATAAEKLTATGTVNRYLRAQWTLPAGTGSITFAVAAARR